MSTPRGKLVSLGGVFSAPEHNPKPLPPNKKPLEELQKSAERLTQLPKPPQPKDDHMLSPRTQRSADQINASVVRLHDQAVEKRQKKLEATETTDDSRKSPKRTPEEISAAVTSLYDQALERKKVSNEKLQQKYLFHPKTSPRVELKSSVDRLYSGSLQKRKEKEEKMFQKYVAASLPKYKKITADEVKSSGERLSTSKR